MIWSYNSLPMRLGQIFPFLYLLLLLKHSARCWKLEKLSPSKLPFSPSEEVHLDKVCALMMPNKFEWMSIMNKTWVKKAQRMWTAHRFHCCLSQKDTLNYAHWLVIANGNSNMTKRQSFKADNYNSSNIKIFIVKIEFNFDALLFWELLIYQFISTYRIILKVRWIKIFYLFKMWFNNFINMW